MTQPTRFLALSDIFWRSQRYPNGTTVELLRQLVENVKPQIVLLAGDLVNNHSRIHENSLRHWSYVRAFLEFLQNKAVYGLYVRGNWDEIPEYDELSAIDARYVMDVSERLVEVAGISIYGLPHAPTRNTTSLRHALAAIPDNVDLLLTHADGRRRIWLFEIPAGLIVTGHFDQQCCVINRSLFVSFSEFPSQTAILDYTSATSEIAYTLLGQGNYTYRASKVGDQLNWLTEAPPFPDATYGQKMEALRDVKLRSEQMSRGELKIAIEGLLAIGVYKNHISEYIPEARPLLT